jgi:chromosome segregation ATPase
MVFGLALGHFLGWSERLELQEHYADLREEKLGEMTDNLVSCITGEEGNGGEDPDLEDRIIKQLNEENNNLKLELAQYKKQLQQHDSGISVEMTAILRDRINDLLVANADLEKEVARLRYSHTAMAEADASKKGLEETETKLKEAKVTLNDISNENQQLKIAIGKARYGTPLVERARTQDLENINELRTENQDLKAQVGKIRYAKPIVSKETIKDDNLPEKNVITTEQPPAYIEQNNDGMELVNPIYAEPNQTQKS